MQPVHEELLLGVYKDGHETQCILYLQSTNYYVYSYQVIFRFALALFKYKEEEILKLQDSMSIFKYLRYFTRTILDARWVTHPGVALRDLEWSMEMLEMSVLWLWCCFHLDSDSYIKQLEMQPTARICHEHFYLAETNQK